MKFIKENYEKFFGKIAEGSSYGKPLPWVEKISEVISGGTVLDLGAGDGRHAIYLAKKEFTVKAVDLSEAGLQKLERLAAEQNVHVATEVADLNTWNIDGEYDVIIAMVILQHLNTESALRLLNEIKAHTKPGGVNAVTIFTNTGDRYLLDREEDPNAFYPEDNWLRTFYQDWELLEYRTLTAPLIGKSKKDGSPMQNTVEEILVRKKK